MSISQVCFNFRAWAGWRFRPSWRKYLGERQAGLWRRFSNLWQSNRTSCMQVDISYHICFYSIAHFQLSLKVKWEQQKLWKLLLKWKGLHILWSTDKISLNSVAYSWFYGVFNILGLILNFWKLRQKWAKIATVQVITQKPLKLK